MAANTGVGGSRQQVQRWTVTVNVRASMTPLNGEGAGKLTAQILEDVRNETLRQFCTLANAIETGEFPPNMPFEHSPEENITANSTDGEEMYLLTRPGYDPCCGVWGDVKGHTLTVVSTDTMLHSLAAYRAEAAPLPDDLKPTQSTPTQPPARQSAPLPPPPNAPYIPDQSESGTFELGEYDYNQKAQYGAQYNGQRVAFWVERIARGYKKDTTIPEYRMFSHDGFQYPDFYVDAEHAGNMLPLLEDVTANGDAVGRWRVVVVVKQKGTKVYFNPVKIETLQRFEAAGPDVGDGENMPF